MVKRESAGTSPLTKDDIQTTKQSYKHFNGVSSTHRWRDSPWMQRREHVEIGESPLAIYKLDPLDWLASWQGVGEKAALDRKTSDWETLDWQALGARLIPYLADLGFTHMELTLVRIDGQAGINGQVGTDGQVGIDKQNACDGIGYDGIDNTAFAHFVDTCHESGLGVIVTSHVPSNKKAVLDAIQRYHLDGVSLPDDTDDSNALALMEGLAQKTLDVFLVVDSSLYASLCSRLPAAAKLLVYNAGWNNVMLEFLSEPPVSRSRYYHALVDSFSHACEAPYLLTLANPDARHPWLARIPGDRWQRFATLRAAMCLMWAYPGKKLLGMGAEFAQDRSRKPRQNLDWTLLDHPHHAGVLRLVADLNRLYGNESALHGCDDLVETVEWVIKDDTTNNVIAFLRHGAQGTAPLLIVVNFTPQVHQGYRLGVPSMGAWYEVINSDSTFYGGSNVGNGQAVRAQMTASHGYPASLELALPPLGALLLKQGDWPA